MNREDCLGAIYLGEERCQFLVWAPLVDKVNLHIVSPEDKIIPLDAIEGGYHRAIIDGLRPGCQYFYQLNDGKQYPDPASRFQADTVHGPSQVVEPFFQWNDRDWRGIPIEKYIIYELHVGTFTEEGTFDALITKLDEIKDLGITALELMPVAQFPGLRNWGYDGVYPFAVQNSYGGPSGLRRLVDACHSRGLAVVLDVVYNHFGPEGNYMSSYGPYFTERYKTPWGSAINFDGPYSDEVRRFFIENAIYWLTDFHIDALRLDALHSILDISPFTFIEELSQAFSEQSSAMGRRAYLIGESAANDTRLIQTRQQGGYGLNAQWNDDFHHSLHVLLTGENKGYYQDYDGLKDLVKAFKTGFVYTGQYSKYRKRRHGRTSIDLPAARFVVFSQNHDQVGNRMKGDRLSEMVPFEKLKLASAIVLLSPFIPLLFMGEEYGEIAPFRYFVHHSDILIISSVRKGRREEFSSFEWREEVPDPQDEATFLSSKLDHSLKNYGWHAVLLDLNRELIKIRKHNPVFANLNNNAMQIKEIDGNIMMIHRWMGKSESLTIFKFGGNEEPANLHIPDGSWKKLLDSTEKKWHGPGSDIPNQIESKIGLQSILHLWSFVIYTKEN